MILPRASTHLNPALPLGMEMLEPPVATGVRTVAAGQHIACRRSTHVEQFAVILPSCGVSLRLVHSTWTELTDLLRVDPVKRRVHWSRVSASRLDWLQRN